MASAPQLPLFYQGLEPLSSDLHRDWRLRVQADAPFLVGQHAIPITAEEFGQAQRFFPIVFGLGDDAVPLALMGLNENVNVFVDDAGKLLEAIYIPAYVRRYPFMLARLRPDAPELSLCFDPTSPAVGPFEDGIPLFENGQASEATRTVLGFNETFEQAGLKTTAFMRELRELGLLMEGEVTIQQEGVERPFVYRGFQMVSEEKLNSLRGDQLRKMQQSGMLPAIHAHLFSIQLMREVFSRQVSQGKMPAPQLPQLSPQM